VLAVLGHHLTDERRLNRAIESADPNHKGTISFSKFVVLVELNQVRH
jgi:Ca2+-binding EF-hand superfamily protein